MRDMEIEATFDSNDTARAVQKALNKWFALIMNSESEEFDDELESIDDDDLNDDDSEEFEEFEEYDDEDEDDDDLDAEDDPSDPFEDFGVSSHDYELDRNEVEWEEAPQVRVHGSQITISPETSLGNEVLQDLLEALGGYEVQIGGEDS